MNKAIWVSVFVLFFAALYVGACSGGDKTKEDSEAGEAVKKGGSEEKDFEMKYQDEETGEDISWESDSEGRGRVVARSKDGEKTAEMSFGGSELPDGFPEEFPLYEGEIANSVKSSSGDGTGYSITMVTDDPVDDVYSWYKKNLSDKGYEIKSSVSMPGIKSLQFQSGERAGTIMVQKDNENVNVVISMTTSG
ncbi:MAG: hypothetical protein R6V10_07910 [bacterium]